MAMTITDADKFAGGLTEEEAKTIFYAIGNRFGWTYCWWNREDLELRLNRRLTDDEWTKIRWSKWWTDIISDVAYENGSETLWDMFSSLEIPDADELEGPGSPRREGRLMAQAHPPQPIIDWVAVPVEHIESIRTELAEVTEKMRGVIHTGLMWRLELLHARLNTKPFPSVERPSS